MPLTLLAEGLTAAFHRFCAKIRVFRLRPLPHTCLISLSVRSGERTKNGFPGHEVRKDFTKGKRIEISSHFIFHIMQNQDYVAEKDTAFAREFENFVNGRMHSAKTTG